MCKAPTITSTSSSSSSARHVGHGMGERREVGCILVGETEPRPSADLSNGIDGSVDVWFDSLKYQIELEVLDRRKFGIGIVQRPGRHVSGIDAF